MSTGSLIRWIALVAGGELAVRGYLAGSIALCHAGAALFALALAALSWRTRARRAGIAFASALLAGTAADAVLALSVSPAGSAGPFVCDQPVAIVEAGSLLEGDLSGQLVLVRDGETAPSVSPLGRAIEAQLRAGSSDLQVARYRETLLSARRAGADVVLLVPPRTRGIRALAGSYGIRAMEVGHELEAVLDARGCE